MSKRVCIGLFFAVCMIPSGVFAQTQFDFPNSPSDSILLLNSNRWSAAANEGKLDSAIIYGQRIASIAKKEFGTNSHAYAVATAYYTGYVYAIMHRYEEAHDCLKKGLDIFVSINDTAGFRYKYTVFYYGVVCYTMSANTEAETYLLQAGRLCREMKDMASFAQSAICLASVYIFRGEYARAESLDLQMKETLDSLPPSDFVRYLQASIDNNLAIIYAETGNPQKSLLCMQEAEETARRNVTKKSSEDYLTIVLNLADAFASAKQTDSAIARCTQVEERLGPDKKNIIYTRLLKEKAHISQQQHHSEQAVGFYEAYTAASATLPVKDDDYDANIINLGMLYTGCRQYRQADSLFRQEIACLREAGFDYSFDLQQSLAGLCANLVAMGKYSEASDSLLALCRLTFLVMTRNFPGMSEADQLHYRTILDGFFDLLYTCIDDDKMLKKEFLSEVFKLELQRKNLILGNEVRLLNRIRNSDDSSLLQLYNEWLNNRQMLSRQYALPASQRFFSTDSLESLCEKLEKKLSAKSPGPVFTGDDMLQPGNDAGNRGIADIEFVRYNHISPGGKTEAMYSAFIGKPGDHVPVFTRLCREQALIRLMKNNKGEWIDNNQLTQKIYNAKSAAAASLYRLVWQPLEPYLHDVRLINYSTAGFLNNIAFHAIHGPKGYLLNTYTLHRYTSLLQMEKQPANNTAPKAISIWGNINYDEAEYGKVAPPVFAGVSAPQEMKLAARTKSVTKAPLRPFDATELSGIKKIFYRYHLRVSSFEGKSATEENFKQQAPAMEAVLHISTHGFYMPDKEQDRLSTLTDVPVNPLFRCGLAFSGINYYWMKGKPKLHHDDGLLTGYEVAQLDLHRLQLVTLSACETGLGDITGNEGNLGLERAFKLAGVHNLLVSLWEVPAKQTAELLSLFYDFWLRGKTPAEALRLAEYSMQKKNYPPYFWAGFVLVE